jgi:hypothetical protein
MMFLLPTRCQPPRHCCSPRLDRLHLRCRLLSLLVRHVCVISPTSILRTVLEIQIRARIQKAFQLAHQSESIFYECLITGGMNAHHTTSRCLHEVAAMAATDQGGFTPGNPEGMNTPIRLVWLDSQTRNIIDTTGRGWDSVSSASRASPASCNRTPDPKNRSQQGVSLTPQNNMFHPSPLSRAV